MAKAAAKSKLPSKFDAYSMAQLSDGRYGIIKLTIENEHLTSSEVVNTEVEKQFAQERFKILTYQEGMSDR